MTAGSDTGPGGGTDGTLLISQISTGAYKSSFRDRGLAPRSRLTIFLHSHVSPTHDEPNLHTEYSHHSVGSAPRSRLTIFLHSQYEFDFPSTRSANCGSST